MSFIILITIIYCYVKWLDSDDRVMKKIREIKKRNLCNHLAMAF